MRYEAEKTALAQETMTRRTLPPEGSQARAGRLQHDVRFEPPHPETPFSANCWWTTDRRKEPCRRQWGMPRPHWHMPLGETTVPLAHASRPAAWPIAASTVCRRQGNLAVFSVLSQAMSRPPNAAKCGVAKLLVESMFRVCGVSCRGVRTTTCLA